MKRKGNVTQTVTRPTLAYGRECWPLAKKCGILHSVFERRILRKIYGPVNDNGTRRTIYSSVVYTFYDKLHRVKVINTGTCR